MFSSKQLFRMDVMHCPTAVWEHVSSKCEGSVVALEPGCYALYFGGANAQAKMRAFAGEIQSTLCGTELKLLE
jgi:hypothetical protein